MAAPLSLGFPPVCWRYTICVNLRCGLSYGGRIKGTELVDRVDLRGRSL